MNVEPAEIAETPDNRLAVEVEPTAKTSIGVFELVVVLFPS